MKNLVISKKSESLESVLFISQAHIILIHYFSFTCLYCHLNFSFLLIVYSFKIYVLTIVIGDFCFKSSFYKLPLTILFYFKLQCVF